METTSFQLSNGLKVIVRESRATPVVTIDAWVNTGSVNEPDELNGVSHFLEHMLFKGTDTRAPNELDMMIEGVGGDWNAGTSKDYTHYHCTVPAPHARLAMDAVSDMLRRSKIDPTELEKERLVILEEYLRKQDSPWGLLWDELYEVGFERSPYRPTILGTQESIRGITREGMFDYFERYYSPANMVLVIAGALGVDEARALAEEHFGDWERSYNPYTDIDRTTELAQKAKRVLNRELNEAYYVLLFPGPSMIETSASLPVDVLEGVLGQGTASRLHRRLVEEEEIAHSISAGSIQHGDTGLFAFFAELEPQKVAQARTAIFEEIQKLHDEEPSTQEVERQKTCAYTHNAFRTETTTGQTSQIGYCYTLTGSTEYEEQYLTRLSEVQPADIQRVARRFLLEESSNELLLKAG